MSTESNMTNTKRDRFATKACVECGASFVPQFEDQQTCSWNCMDMQLERMQTALDESFISRPVHFERVRPC